MGGRPLIVDENGNIPCGTCKVYKPKSAFFKQKNNHRGISNRCKECSKKYSTQWRLNNPEKTFTVETRSRLKRLYNITLEDFYTLSKKQDNCCAICSKQLRLEQDHNHEFGFNRGLLCGKCNKILGFAKDDVNILQAAIDYLHKWEI